jgi:hypothetical protein
MLPSLDRASAAEIETTMMKNADETAEKDSLNSGRLTHPPSLFCRFGETGMRLWRKPQEQLSTR